MSWRSTPNDVDQLLAARRSEQRRREVLTSFSLGFLIGSAGYAFQSRRSFSLASAIGAGGFLGTCLGLGAYFKSL